MLKSLGLINFKSWSEIRSLSLPGLTGIFGTNSSGKSSIIQSLLLLKQTVASPDRSMPLNFGEARDYVELGSFKDIVYEHKDETNILEFCLKWSISEPLVIEDPDLHNEIICESTECSFQVKLQRGKDGGCSVVSFTYKIGEMKVTLEQKSKPGEYDLSTTGGLNNFKFVRTQGRVWKLPRPFKFHGFPDQAVTYFQNSGFLPDLQRLLEAQLSQIHYLGPLREYPQRKYNWSGNEPSDMGRRGENVVAAILSKGKERYISLGKNKKRQTLQERIAYWLKELGLIHSFSVTSIAAGTNLYEVKVKKNPRSAEVVITDVGFGVSQILPVIALCYYVDEGSTILLEQPEIHLHPAVQMGLADVFIDAIKTRKIQLVIESHSEHLLSRLQRRMAEEKIKSDDISINFCSSGEVGSKIEHLQIDNDGNISNWPKDFFGDRFGEVALQRKAALVKKIQAETK